MTIVPTRTTAAMAGAWAAFGFGPLETWVGRQGATSALDHDIVWLLLVFAFLILPSYLLVLGRDAKPFDRTWFSDPSERARYGAVAGRMIVWFLSAGALILLWSGVHEWLAGTT